jgi:hypothetical protein
MERTQRSGNTVVQCCKVVRGEGFALSNGSVSTCVSRVVYAADFVAAMHSTIHLFSVRTFRAIHVITVTSRNHHY